MGSARSDRDRDRPPLAAHKILIAGGFGSGKTTLVGAISEVRPLRTEELLTTASVGMDDLSGAVTVIRQRSAGLRPGNDVLQEILNGLRAL